MTHPEHKWGLNTVLFLCTGILTASTAASRAVDFILAFTEAPDTGESVSQPQATAAR
jgi:hypothetical protein